MDGLHSPRLSIIIPCLERDEHLESTLVSVLENRPASSEVILVHQGPYDDPYDLADEIRIIEAPPEADLLACMNVGVELAKGDVVHLVQCGIEVTESWADVAMVHFEDPRVGMVSPVLVDAVDPTRIVAAGVQIKLDGSRRICGTGAKISHRKCRKMRFHGPTYLAAFYRRSAVQSCGGFDSTVGEQLVDLDLALSINALNFDAVLEPDCVVRTLNIADFQQSATHSPFAQGRFAERMVWRHAPTVGWIRSVLPRVFYLAAEIVKGKGSLSAFARLSGRLAAYFEVMNFRRHYRRLAAARVQENQATRLPQPAQRRRSQAA